MLPRKKVTIETMIKVRRAMFIAALVGLFAAIYLLITYTSGKEIVCGATGGCEAVRASEWAYVGPIPLPAFGVLFYAGLVGWLLYRLAFAKASHQRILLELTWIGTFIGFAESVGLFYVQAAIIKSFCTWCLVSGAAATSLFLLSLFDSAEPLSEKQTGKEIKWSFYALLISFILGGLLLWNLLYRSDEAGQLSSGNVTVEQLLPTALPIEGPATATVAVIEFLDFECAGCAAYHPLMKQIRQEFAGKIRYAQRLMPLVEIHTFARPAAIAAVCADKQGRFFDYGDALLANRLNLTRPDLERYASALRLDSAKFKTCLDDPSIGSFVDTERKAADAIGIKQTPTIFVNDLALDNLPTLEQFRGILKSKLGE